MLAKGIFCALFGGISAACGSITTLQDYHSLDVGVRSTIECESNSKCTLYCIDAVF